MRKPEKSVEPSMEEILASIRKIIAEEPPPAGHVAKDGDVAHPGSAAAPPASDLSDLFDEQPARDAPERQDVAGAPQAAQPDRRMGAPQAPFGANPVRNQHQLPGGAQPSPLPGGNFLSAAPVEQSKSPAEPRNQPIKDEVGEAGPNQPGGGTPLPGTPPAGGHDLQLATRLKDLSTAGAGREAERSAPAPNPFTDSPAPAGPGAPPRSAPDPAKAEQDRVGAQPPKGMPGPVTEAALEPARPRR